MSRIWGVALLLSAGLTGMPAMAATFTYNYTWTAGDRPGQSAGSCSYIMPDIRPLQVPRTLVVDSAAPVGTVLYSWDFNSFLPGFRLQCTGSGIDNGNSSTSVNGTNVGANMILAELSFAGLTTSPVSSRSNPMYATTLSGIGLRLSVRADSDSILTGTMASIYSQFLGLFETTGGATVSAPPRDTVYLWGGYGVAKAQMFIRPFMNDAGRYYVTSSATGFSVKAELVKIADTVQYGNLGLAGSTAATWSTPAALRPALPTDLLSGNAITVVSPSCRLRTTDYTISMGTWAADTINHTGTPASGSAQPVGLDLECMGRPADVQFRFEDTGSAPSTAAQKNVTLYDGGGNKVNGLEIQMKYNGSRVNIDGVTQTSTGARGQAHDNSGLAPTYIAAGQAMFTANYIQNGPITVGGNNYTGPVSGKVNVWVTYN
ncbi:hypothetical protein [Metakosakonia massiliensis]|uniref:Fimbrial protein n=1 Tax=Phytobacter massiliensis TaxID=1485952 RepID=A0A6N3FM60_9ENTR